MEHLIENRKKNSLKKLQDGGDHLCYGLHGGILITVAHKTDKLISSYQFERPKYL